MVQMQYTQQSIQQFTNKQLTMTDIIKLTEDLSKTKSTEHLKKEKYEKTMDWEKYSSNDFNLMRHKNVSSYHNFLESNTKQRLVKERSIKEIEIIDLESEEYVNQQKILSKQNADSTTNNIQQSSRSFKQSNSMTLSDVQNKQQNFELGIEIKYSILKSQTLNQKCTKCESTLLSEKSSSKWVQCIECLQICHEPCQIQISKNNLKIPVCSNCVSKKKRLSSNNAILSKVKLNLKTQKKNLLEKQKVFRERPQGFYHLDSFLNGFIYKLAISDQQVKKDIVILSHGHKIENITQKSSKRC